MHFIPHINIIIAIAIAMYIVQIASYIHSFTHSTCSLFNYKICMWNVLGHGLNLVNCCFEIRLCWCAVCVRACILKCFIFWKIILIQRTFSSRLVERRFLFLFISIWCCGGCGCFWFFSFFSPYSHFHLYALVNRIESNTERKETRKASNKCVCGVD